MLAANLDVWIYYIPVQIIRLCDTRYERQDVENRKQYANTVTKLKPEWNTGIDYKNIFGNTIELLTFYLTYDAFTKVLNIN